MRILTRYTKCRECGTEATVTDITWWPEENKSQHKFTIKCPNGHVADSKSMPKLVRKVEHKTILAEHVQPSDKHIATSPNGAWVSVDTELSKGELSYWD